MHQLRLRTIAVASIATLALAACGSSSKASSTATTTPATSAPATSAPATTVAPPTTTAAATPTVTLATTKLGMVLVDAKGMTLYRFDNDTTAGKSNCGAGPCATTWPAATVTGAAAAGPGIDAAKLTTFKRDDGTTQIQMDGHPLYTFAGDAKAGDTNGQGILGKWFAATATGAKAG